MRPRTKTTVVCSANPQGRRNLSRKEVLRNKFNRGDITTEELREYSCFLTHSEIEKGMASKTPVAVITTVWGKEKKIPYAEFKAEWEPQGFKIIKTIY